MPRCRPIANRGHHDMNEISRPNNLDAFWMPYSANRSFKAHPRLLARAEGMYYYTNDNREILDGTAGLCAATPGTAGGRSWRRSSARPR